MGHAKACGVPAAGCSCCSFWVTSSCAPRAFPRRRRSADRGPLQIYVWKVGFVLVPFLLRLSLHIFAPGLLIFAPESGPSLSSLWPIFVQSLSIFVQSLSNLCPIFVQSLSNLVIVRQVSRDRKKLAPTKSQVRSAESELT